MTDEIDYTDDSIFPTRGLIPEVDGVRDRKIKEQKERNSTGIDLGECKCGMCAFCIREMARKNH